MEIHGLFGVIGEVSPASLFRSPVPEAGKTLPI